MGCKPGPLCPPFTTSTLQIGIENDFQNFHRGPLPLIADFESIFKIPKRDPRSYKSKMEPKKMKVVITGNSATLYGPFPISFIATISLLNGKKVWLNSSTIKFEALTNNVKRLQNCGHEITFIDETGTLADLADFENMPDQTAQIPVVHTNYKPKLPLRDYQQKAVNLSAERKSYAYLMEVGLGKTAVVITNIGLLVMANKLTGVLLIAPKGVHSQFVNEQLVEHLDDAIIYEAHVWKGIVPKFKNKTQLQVLAMNVDSMRTKNGFKVASDFLKSHDGKSMMIVDESHHIKSASAQRTKAAFSLGSMATYRRILTGTPIASNVSDLFAQFKFLDERILGHRYFVSFRNHFCVMGGFEQRQIIGSKNTEELYSLISRHSFRLTKSEALDLPEKIYIKRRYEPSEIVMQHYNALKNNFLTQLDNGDIVDVNNAIVCLLRLQQVICGYLPREDGTFESFSDDRIEQMMEIINQTEDQVIIWCRFSEDIRRISDKLNTQFGKGSAVLYYGDNVKDRDESVTLFLEKKARFFISNPSAGGSGLNLQKSGCTTMIFYSNSFNFINREQAEGRIHRLGTKGAVSYFDLVADKTIDARVLKNLTGKKAISSFTLDEIRQALI
jgi:superfamily II DNA or RNA helicase